MAESGRGELVVKASIAKHLAFAPVAFAITGGPEHTVLYANAVFKGMQKSGAISIGRKVARGSPATADLKPLLDRVTRTAETVRDSVVPPTNGGEPSWSCTIWPVSESDGAPGKLVIEVRDVAMVEGAKARQRAIAEQLLMGALREQDVARDAVTTSDRARHLSDASRDLAMSLDESATRDVVRRITLPRAGTWCIVDVIESNGAIHRLAVVHPNPEKEALARKLEELWPSIAMSGVPTVLPSERPVVVTHESGAALMAAAHGPANLAVLKEIGFGSLLVGPLIGRARVQGAITFVTAEGDPPFTREEATLAMDLASRCALALDNARLYREADALRLVAEMANQSKSQFLGTMSHELRTPLNAIGGFAELIELGIQGPVTETQQVSLARIRANQQHLLMLITEILSFVRIESGRMEYHNEDVPMLHALKDVSDMLGVAIREKGLTLALEPEDVIAVVWADPSRVRQILMNLVMNAVKYGSESGGSIALRCAVVGDVVQAHVTDTGPGIPKEKLESIFEPFVQLTADLAERRSGVGLGLAISRDLARAMGGDLTVESTFGSGATFTLALPLARAETPPHERASDQGSSAAVIA
jgi:signal transduction histidine kinase